MTDSPAPDLPAPASERITALEFRSARLANAADLLWRCAVVIATLGPILEAVLTSRFPLATLLSSATLLLICWVVREYLFVTVAHVEVVAEQAARSFLRSSAPDDPATDVDPAASRSTSS
ncbi:hypothetical protein OVN18_12865 [Microcella daejeonensis]|uniref:Uncharacterized protein n=1 Tax=Microcella daejeonensis TaxID=2994971 RepID=A0A9E8MMG2_9MICO|nr:hypothetical protein [Microcella daejeonensis]WAB81406.1 hypothetical protein OVN18_12865 [Microcella daejeonensis]